MIFSTMRQFVDSQHPWNIGRYQESLHHKMLSDLRSSLLTGLHLLRVTYSRQQDLARVRKVGLSSSWSIERPGRVQIGGAERWRR